MSVAEAIGGFIPRIVVWKINRDIRSINADTAKIEEAIRRLKIQDSDDD